MDLPSRIKQKFRELTKTEKFPEGDFDDALYPKVVEIIDEFGLFDVEQLGSKWEAFVQGRRDVRITEKKLGEWKEDLRKKSVVVKKDATPKKVDRNSILAYVLFLHFHIQAKILYDLLSYGISSTHFN